MRLLSSTHSCGATVVAPRDVVLVVALTIGPLPPPLSPQSPGKNATPIFSAKAPYTAKSYPAQNGMLRQCQPRFSFFPLICQCGGFLHSRMFPTSPATVACVCLLIPNGIATRERRQRPQFKHK